MEFGLTNLGQQAARVPREEYVIIRDEPAYEMVRSIIPQGEMEDIDGWARSVYTLEGHLEAIHAYRKPLLPEPTDTRWEEAKSAVMAEVQHELGAIDSLDFSSDLALVPYEASSAAGYGYTGRKGEGNNFSKAIRITNAAIRQYDEDIHQFGLDRANFGITENSTPDIGLTRTQLAKLPQLKVRNVFGEAFHYILIEGLSAFPLLSAFKSRDTFYFIGEDPTIWVPSIVEEMELNSNWFIVLDWSGFDASVQNWEIDFAFNCLKSVMTFPNRLSELAFDYSRAIFKRRKILAPDGQMYMRNSGIPSGSYFTNMVGSIINYTRIKFLMFTLGLPIYKIRVQGDDSITATTSEAAPDARRLASIGQQYGWTLKPEKCIITDYSTEVVFLGRSMRHRYNVRERNRALRLICFPEFRVTDPTISTARVHAIMNDAGNVDSLFDKIYLAMYNTYGEAQTVPNELLPFHQRQFYM